MSAEPLTREERLHLFSPRVREFGKASWVDVERYEATVQAAEERAERAEARLRAWGIPLEPAPDLMAALKASLAADDAARGDQ